MPRDFYEVAGSAQRRLGRSDLQLLDFVVRNLHEAAHMSIRELAGRCYVSTTTVFRFVQHLGFTGYVEFVTCLRLTDTDRPQVEIPARLLERGYGEEYLKNIIETIRVIPSDKVAAFIEVMRARPRVVILSDGLSRQAGHYVRYLLTALGFHTELPREEFQLRALPNNIGEGDVLLVLSYSGENRSVLAVLERVLARSKPTVITITNAATNAIFALGDMDLYVFSDAASYRGTDITSRVGMIAVIEYLLTALLATESEQDDGADPALAGTLTDAARQLD